MKRYLSKRNLMYVGGAIILAGAIFWGLKNGQDKQIISISRADLVQEVAATGKVKPNQSVNLGFDKSGRVGKVYVAIGEQVSQGQVIAVLESGEVSADLAKAKAALLEENIKLREIKNTAPITFSDATKNLEASIKEGYALADNAVRNRADQFFKNNISNPRFEVSITSGNFVHYFEVESGVTLDINSSRKKVETVLVDWQKRNANINSANLVSEADRAIADLNFITGFLDKIAGAVNSFTSADYAYDTTINGYKTTISTARNDVSGAISSLVTAKDKFNSAPILGEAGQFEIILTQEAKVAQAEAVVSALEASLNKSVIRAPFDGVVTLQEAKLGSTVLAGTTLVSVVSQNQMYIEVNISEIHIGKIAVGNSVRVNFDAFADEEFQGFVSYIEPGDVIIDGVVNYKIRVELGEAFVGENGQQIMRFDNADEKIKNGLTANLKIQTSKKVGVVAIPLYAVTKEGDQDFVNKIVGENIEKTLVNLGMIASDGSVEVLKGLVEGDLVGF